MDRILNTTASGVRFDAGLRRHMIGIYRTMALGLVVTAAMALFVSSTPALVAAIFGTPLKWVAMLAPLAPHESSVGPARMEPTASAVTAAMPSVSDTGTTDLAAMTSPGGTRSGAQAAVPRVFINL